LTYLRTFAAWAAFSLATVNTLLIGCATTTQTGLPSPNEYINWMAISVAWWLWWTLPRPKAAG